MILWRVVLSVALFAACEPALAQAVRVAAATIQQDNSMGPPVLAEPAAAPVPSKPAPIIPNVRPGGTPPPPATAAPAAPAPVAQPAAATEPTPPKEPAPEPSPAPAVRPAAEPAKPVPPPPATKLTAEEKPAAEPAVTVPAITNLDSIEKFLKLKDFKNCKFGRRVRIAVLDNSFFGYQTEVGERLPAGTQYFPGVKSDADRFEDKSMHGLFMAILIHQIVLKSGCQADYQLSLFNSNGLTKFTDAVNSVIRDGYDIVLYSQVWEYGGNGNSRGFIDAIVNKALDAGILWINAAGNFGRLTRIAPVEPIANSSGDWVRFSAGNGKWTDAVKLRCKAEKDKTCPMRIVLTWNDFKDSPDIGTNKDLDLYLVDTYGEVRESSIFRQSQEPDPNDPTARLFPREFLTRMVLPGEYRIKVKIKSKNFTSTDRLRITASGAGIEMLNPSIGETMLPPADDPRVLDVGALDDPGTSISKKMNRPDVFLPSVILLKDGSTPFSTSVAAAVAAGMSVLYLGTGVEKTKSAVLPKLKALTRQPVVTVAAPTAKPSLGVSTPAGPAGGNDTHLARPNIYEQNGMPPRPPAELGRPPLDYYGGPSVPPLAPGPNGSLADRDYIYEQNGMLPRPPTEPGRRPSDYYGRPSVPLAPGPNWSLADRDCVTLVQISNIYPSLLALLQHGGAAPVIYAGRLVIQVNYDYIASNRLRVLSRDDRTYITPLGPAIVDLGRVPVSELPSGSIEVICGDRPICEERGGHG